MNPWNPGAPEEWSPDAPGPTTSLSEVPMPLPLPDFFIAFPQFQLIRAGKCRAFIRRGEIRNAMDEAPLGEAFVVNHENRKMSLPILVHRVSYVELQHLSTHDARLAGFMNLDGLQRHLLDVQETDVVTLLEFTRLDDTEG